MPSSSLRRGAALSAQVRERLFRRYFSDSSLPVSSVARRTQKSNPGDHSAEEVGLYYRLDDSLRTTLFALGGFPKSLTSNLNTFGETCLMVRKPAVDIINLLKRADCSKPVIRYLLFGKAGCGKSVSLAHILHYAYVNDFVILHVPWVWNWMRNVRHEVTEAWKGPSGTASDSTEEVKTMVDLPLVAAGWLKHFQLQNSQILNKLSLESTEEHKWSQREVTPAGAPLTDLVSHGINRVKFSCAVVDALIHQLKHHANQNKCKVLVAVDGFNALFGEKTNLKREDKSAVSPSHLSLTHSFLRATDNDWINGAVIVTVDELSGQHGALASHYPLYLLGRKGFEHLDPFVGVQVKELTNKEVESMLDYYEDRKWIQCQSGRHELAFLSNANPYQLMNLCASI